ncbi:LysR family transcriptional regulator [Humitalea sp. 24SJ18S-53]|uniref:LysR family transcriptional regulator n=1 Tax=Humitalea sp. 24SJ18S-53 TaxID=3422307 RepID=UPI003D672F65
MRRIEVFVAVAEAGGFSAAADRLGISQPSVSAHVQALERELGGEPLLERHSGRPPRLTETGTMFLEQAKILLHQAQAVAAGARQHRHDAARRVVLACQPHITNFVLPRVLAGFVRDSGGIELVIRSGASETVPERIRNGTADIGCMLGTPDLERLHCRRLGTEPYILVAAPGHPLAGRQHIPPSELEAHDFVCGPRTALLTREMARGAAEIGIARMKVVARATEYNMRRALVQAGVGLLWTPQSSAGPDVRDGHLVALNLDAPPVLVPINLVWCTGREISRPAMALTDYLTRHVPKR